MTLAGRIDVLGTETHCFAILRKEFFKTTHDPQISVPFSRQIYPQTQLVLEADLAIKRLHTTIANIDISVL